MIGFAVIGKVHR